MARKIKASASLAVATDGDDILIGSNREDQPGDVLDGGAGNDYLDAFQGADTLTGGSGADTFKLHSWASSNVTYGVDTITDFSVAEGDVIDLSNISYYSGVDHMDVRDIMFADVELTPIAGGNELHVAVWEGDATWDVTMIVLGETPVESSFIF